MLGASRWLEPTAGAIVVNNSAIPVLILNAAERDILDPPKTFARWNRRSIEGRNKQFCFTPANDAERWQQL